MVVGGDFSSNLRDRKLDIDCDPQTTCNSGIPCILTPASLQKTLQQTKKLFCSYVRESLPIVVCIDVSCDLYTVWCTAIALVTKTGFGLHRLICLVDSYTVWHIAVAKVTKTGFWLQIRMQCSCFNFQSQDLDYNHVSFISTMINSIVMQCRINFIPACIFLISQTHIILDNNLALRVWLNTHNFEYQLNCCICSLWNPSFQSFGCRS